MTHIPRLESYHSEGSDRIHIWLRESYLVVLGKRRRHYQLITAFCIDREHTKRKNRKERDASRNG